MALTAVLRPMVVAVIVVVVVVVVVGLLRAQRLRGHYPQAAQEQ